MKSTKNLRVFARRFFVVHAIIIINMQSQVEDQQK